MQIPFFDSISGSKVVLLAGVGGGFDIVSGIPIYSYLRKLGKEVILANLSFTELALSDCEPLCHGTYLIKPESKDLDYFPEKHLARWLRSKGEDPIIYGFSDELGVAPLSHAYQKIIDKHGVDCLILIDGGTDGLMFGDESGVATMVEDACSIVAASLSTVEKSFLVATGFGVEQFHNLNHHSCLENISTLIKNDSYFGSISITKDMKEGKEYIELVDYLNVKHPGHMSIVTNSISASMKGEFGDVHPTPRTTNSEQFISPLMGLFWFFSLEGVSSRIQFRNKIVSSQTMSEVSNAFRMHRILNKQRKNKKIPL
jgi:hypothetical protein